MSSCCVVGARTKVVKRSKNGCSYSSVGRAGVPCIEAVGPLQRSQVRIPPVAHLLRVIPSLSAPFPVVSSAVPIKLKAKAQKIIFKKKNTYLTGGFLSNPERRKEKGFLGGGSLSMM